ncbi:hypothetical protein LCGC14_0475860 [marine sediment metagenome]|uniref:Uncharacterized protein n=1 Tax=marine sediment metagenome TaxID=412755 RepID=A0A0F9SG14_9ZZZZ
MIRVRFINNDGGGFADDVEVSEGTTLGTLFAQQIPEHSKPENYLIRCNREPASASYVLQNLDKVSITPKKIDGGSIL